MSWEKNNYICSSCKKDFNDLLDNKIPLISLDKDIITNNERINILNIIKNIKPRNYEITDDGQNVSYWGIPFIEYDTCKNYMNANNDNVIDELLSTVTNKILNHLNEIGYEAEILRDNNNNKFKAGIIRSIFVNENETVLHIDNILIDGCFKPDFKIPNVLKEEKIVQFSFNILLNDGDTKNESLFIYDKRFQNKDKKYLLENNWQFNKNIIIDTQLFKYKPYNNNSFIFLTENYHDMKGGNKYNPRITYSIFGLYVKSKNKIYLYN